MSIEKLSVEHGQQSEPSVANQPVSPIARAKDIFQNRVMPVIESVILLPFSASTGPVGKPKVEFDDKGGAHTKGEADTDEPGYSHMAGYFTPETVADARKIAEESGRTVEDVLIQWATTVH